MYCFPISWETHGNTRTCVEAIHCWRGPNLTHDGPSSLEISVHEKKKNSSLDNNVDLRQRLITLCMCAKISTGHASHQTRISLWLGPATIETWSVNLHPQSGRYKGHKKEATCNRWSMLIQSLIPLCSQKYLYIYIYNIIYKYILIILYYIILYYIILYNYIILYHIILYYILFYYIVLYCIVLYIYSQGCLCGWIWFEHQALLKILCSHVDPHGHQGAPTRFHNRRSGCAPVA